MQDDFSAWMAEAASRVQAESRLCVAHFVLSWALHSQPNAFYSPAWRMGPSNHFWADAELLLSSTQLRRCELAEVVSTCRMS